MMEKKQTNPERNRPAEKGRNNDPFTRDDSGQQPGVQTMSDSAGDEESDERLSRTASENFREKNVGKDADPAFDEIDENRADR